MTCAPTIPALGMSGIHKRYGTTVALAGVDLHVEPGEIVGLLGPNGAGKSTLMKIAAGVVAPDEGQVRVVGADAGERGGQARRAVSYVPDEGGLLPRLTGWEHLMLTARLWNLDPDWAERGRALLERLGIADAAGKRTSSYSHGMGRRLAVAMAALPRTAVILLDEPFDGVDPVGIVEMRHLISELAEAGAGVVLSTHLLDTAVRVVDRAQIVTGGAVVASGTTSEIAAQAGGDIEAAYIALVAHPAR